MQLRRDLLPALREKGVKLYLVSIGTPERGLEFVEKTGASQATWAVAPSILWPRLLVAMLPQHRVVTGCLAAWAAQVPAAAAAARTNAVPDNPHFAPCLLRPTTGFPADLLLCDPDNVTYTSLGLKKGVRQTFFSYEVRGQLAQVDFRGGRRPPSTGRGPACLPTCLPTHPAHLPAS